MLTDLGCPSSAATEAIAESRLVVLEANHDEAMLRRGPYPQRLQRRILSDSGHLSNAGCADLLARAIRGSTQPPTVWLAHLSETNNRPHLAKQTVQRRLAQVGLRLDLQALPRRKAMKRGLRIPRNLESRSCRSISQILAGTPSLKQSQAQIGAERRRPQ